MAQILASASRGLQTRLLKVQSLIARETRKLASWPQMLHIPANVPKNTPVGRQVPVGHKMEGNDQNMLASSVLTAPSLRLTSITAK